MKRAAGSFSALNGMKTLWGGCRLIIRRRLTDIVKKPLEQKIPVCSAVHKIDIKRKIKIRQRHVADVFFVGRIARDKLRNDCGTGVDGDLQQGIVQIRCGDLLVAGVEDYMRFSDQA